MKEYEKPLMEVLVIDGNVVTESCPEDTYPCGLETPGYCVYGEV